MCLQRRYRQKISIVGLVGLCTRIPRRHGSYPQQDQRSLLYSPILYIVPSSKVYTDLYNIRPAVYDQVGRMTQDEVDEWAKRTGVGIALEQLAELVTIDHAETLIKIVRF